MIKETEPDFYKSLMRMYKKQVELEEDVERLRLAIETRDLEKKLGL